MAHLTTQVVQGLNAVTVAAATAGGDSISLDYGVKIRLVNGGGATCNMTVTPAGPFVGAEITARATPIAAGATANVDAWVYPGYRSSPKYGKATITYDQVASCSVGAFVVAGG